MPRPFILSVACLAVPMVLGACGDDTPTAPPGVPTAGLLAYLPLNGDALDASGNGNHGTLLGGASVASGALVLGNNATDMLTLPASVMDGLGDFTFAAWLRLDVLRNENREVISGANGTQDNELIFWYREQTHAWLAGVDNGSSAFPSDDRIEDGAWHHVVLTRSGSLARLYLDGAPVGGTVAIDGAALDIDPGGLVFGQDQDTVGGAFAANESWAGAMDNLRIYNRALDSGEVERVAAEAR